MSSNMSSLLILASMAVGFVIGSLIYLVINTIIEYYKDRRKR